MVAFVHIEYSTYQFSEESKGPYGTKKSVVLRGLKDTSICTLWNLKRKNRIIYIKKHVSRINLCQGFTHDRMSVLARAVLVDSQNAIPLPNMKQHL